MTSEILNISILLSIINFIIYFKFKSISLKINLFDLPDNNRKTHKEPVAAIGGFIIFFNLFIIYFYNLHYQVIDENLNYLIIFSFLIFLICIYDDKYNLSAIIKFILITIVVFSAILFDNNFIIEEINFTSLRACHKIAINN